MTKGPTYDKALEAMISERFQTPDPEVWASAAGDLRQLFGRWENRLPPAMWGALSNGLEQASTTGDCYPLIEAATVCQIELRRIARQHMVARERRKTRPKQKAAVLPPGKTLADILKKR